MSLREQKKRSTFTEIVGGAEALFNDVGYDATSMEAIAEAARVSPGTVYNYFGTKNAILAAVVTERMDEILVDAQDRLNLDASDPIDALIPTLESYLDEMTAFGPGLLKELLRAGFDPAQTELLADFVSSDERALAQLSDALRAMRDRGLVSRVVDVDAAALVVYSVIVVALMMFASIPGMTSEEIKITCRAQLEIVFSGLAAR